MASHSAALSDMAAEVDSLHDSSDTDDFELDSEDGSNDLMLKFTGELKWDSTASTERKDDAVAFSSLSGDDYPSLPIDSEQEIRLLQVQPSTDPWNIDCRLFIEQRDGSVEYEALSYTWGASTLGKCVRVNGRDFPVTHNLYAAIRRLQLPDAPRILWIDAICINQGKLEERAAQVRKMDQVYATASKTIVWLGDCNESYVGPPSELDRRQADLADFELWRLQDYQLRSFMAAIRDAEPKWWDRAWTVQEVVVAKSEPVVAYGCHIMQYSNLSKLLSTVPKGYKTSSPVVRTENAGRYPDLILLNGVLTLDEARQTIDRFTKRLHNVKSLRRLRRMGTASLYEVLLLTNGLTARDDQDRIFSLLGMISEQEAQLIDVDYRMSCAELDKRTTIAAVSARADFYPLMRVIKLGLFNQQGSPPAIDQPLGSELRQSWHVELAHSLSLYYPATTAWSQTTVWSLHGPAFDAHNRWARVHWPYPSVTDGPLPNYNDGTNNTRGSLRIHGFAMCKVRAICYQISDSTTAAVREAHPDQSAGLNLLKELKRHIQQRPHLEELSSNVTHPAAGLSKTDAILRSLKQLEHTGYDAAKTALDGGKRLRPPPVLPHKGEHGVISHLRHFINPMSPDDTIPFEAFFNWDIYRGIVSDCVVAFCTDDGYLGLGRGGVEAGDVIALPDGRTPGALALRPEEDGALFSMKGFVMLEKDSQLPADTSRWFNLV